MKHSLTILAAACIFASCSENKPNTTNNAIATDTTNAVVVESNAYLYGNNGDTVLLMLQNTNEEITGTLSILPFEKDSRIGTIYAGKMNGDTLYAMFNSTQEGQDSDCEIAFLRKESGFVLTNDIYSETNYQYNKDYTKGSFISKGKIKFDGEFLRKVSK
jgi:hypothetical protein